MTNAINPLTGQRGPKVLKSNAFGSQLVPVDDKLQLAVGGELNKLASNISMFRQFAGVHWRADSINGMLLGEQIAIHLLVQQTVPIRDSANRPIVHFYREHGGASHPHSGSRHSTEKLSRSRMVRLRTFLKATTPSCKVCDWIREGR